MRIRAMSSGLVAAALCAALLALALSTSSGALAPNLDEQITPAQDSLLAAFLEPTTSSPIALSADKNLLWVVNPDDDGISVIRTDLDIEIQRIAVGKEPQSIALDPNNTYAYVANAASNSVSVIRILSYVPPGIATVAVENTIRTGAEPWNIVISPDGKRVYVANSGQDTISVIRADVTPPALLGNVDLRNSACNVGDPNRHFQPRGMAIDLTSTRLYVTRFLSLTAAGGTQASNAGKTGAVCRMDIDTATILSPGISGFTPITLAPQDSGFGGELAYPNQLQSIVIRGNAAYLPNIAAAPAAPLAFNRDTHAFVNILVGVTGPAQIDFGALNLHLGARIPEVGKTKLFFANPWAMAFSNQSGAGNAYVVSSGSDLVVKLNVDAFGSLAFTNGVSTTRYIDLNDPANVVTSGRNAGKNPLGIVVRDTGASRKAYVMNYISRNISVIDLNTDVVSNVINLTNLPLASSSSEQLQVGKEVFFSSRGNFDSPYGTTVATTNRLSSEGWQSCSSCHPAGLTDGVVWAFGAGPRKSVPLNGTFSPHNPADQRVLNYSAIFDEVEDFEINIRNVSGPGPLSAGPPPVLDPNHGLIISDTGDINTAPGVLNAFGKANAGRPQFTLTLPASVTSWPALEAVKEWVRSGIRTPNGALTSDELVAGGGSPTGGLNPLDVTQGRRLFFQQGCQTCHGGTKWTISHKDFTSPPIPTDIATENPPITTTVNAQYLQRFLVNVNSFNLNVAGSGNAIPGAPAIGAIEKAATGQDALGRDYDVNGTGIGYNIPSLLGIHHLPPYYHNGACETLSCVVADVNHRTANGTKPDRLANPLDQARVVAFLQSLDAETVFPTNLSVDRHDIFLDPPTVFANATGVVGANVQLFGSRSDLDPISNTLRVRFTGPGLNVELPLPAFTQDFGQATVTTTWTVPAQAGLARITVQVDSTNVVAEASENDNTAARNILVRMPPPDTTPPVVNQTRISDDNPFNENDPIATTRNVQVRIVATDPSAPPTITGLDSYCIVRYFFNTATRRWVESSCVFEPLPVADLSAGDTFTYTVNANIPPFEGTSYAFTWVRDLAGNIARTPGFDVISFIPSTPININRNDVRLFRLTLVPGQTLTVTVPIAFGDVDVSVFDNVTTTANRIALSAKNSRSTEVVSFTNTFGALRTFQVEVRAIVNSRFNVTFQSFPLALAGEGDFAEDAPEVLLAGPLFDALLADPVKEGLSTTPLIAGPPALQTAVGEPVEVRLPETALSVADPTRCYLDASQTPQMVCEASELRTYPLPPKGSESRVLHE